MKTADWILKTLEKNNIVEYVFCIPGGLIDGFIPYFCEPSHKLKLIIAASETGAAYMADGYGRARLELGVVMTISGPGSTNTVTPIATAYADQSSLLAITGEINLPSQGIGAIQDGSEEGIDITTMLEPITKFNHSISHVAQVSHSLTEALCVALRMKAPTHLSVPTDIQQAEIDAPIPNLNEMIRNNIANKVMVDGLIPLFDKNKFKIALLVGKEVISCEATQALVSLAEKYQLPVFTTIEAKGAIPDDHMLSMGVMGYSGSRHAVEVILSEELDYLIVIGAELNSRDTVNFTKHFASQATLLYFTEHIQFLGRLFRFPDFFALIRADELLNFLLHNDKLNWKNSVPRRKKWLESLCEKKRYIMPHNRKEKSIPIHPARVITDLRKAMPRETVLIVDSGAHTAFAAHYWESFIPNHFLLAGTMGPMGWAIPAGIGAKLARPEFPHVILTGDGCMLMQGMELHTAAKYKIPVIVVIINNCSYGNVYERFHNIPAQAALMEIPDRDWVGFAKSLGGNGIRVTDPDELLPAFKKAQKEKHVPFVVDVVCNKENVTTVEETMRAAGWGWKYEPQ